MKDSYGRNMAVAAEDFNKIEAVEAVEEVVPQYTVITEVNRLHEELQILSSAIATLEDKLGSILLPETTDFDAEAAPRDATGSNIRSNIIDARYLIKSKSKMIYDLICRIDL